mgnify:CR=1 FL=1
MEQEGESEVERVNRINIFSTLHKILLSILLVVDSMMLMDSRDLVLMVHL